MGFNPITDMPGMKLWGAINPSVGKTLDMLSDKDDSGAMRDENERLRKQMSDMQAAQAGKTPAMRKGGKVSSKSSASKRGDGIAQRGKTRGRVC